MNIQHQQLICVTPHCSYNLVINDWVDIQEHLGEEHQIMLKSKFISKIYSFIDDQEQVKQSIYREYRKIILDQVQQWKKLYIELIEKQIDSFYSLIEIELQDLITDVIKDINNKLYISLEEFSQSTRTINISTINQLLDIYDQKNPYPKKQFSLQMNDLQNKIDNQCRKLEQQLILLIESEKYNQNNSIQDYHTNEEIVDLQIEEIEEKILLNRVLEDNQVKSLFSEECHRTINSSNDIQEKKKEKKKLKLRPNQFFLQQVQQYGIQYENTKSNDFEKSKLKAYKQLEQQQQQQQQQQQYQQQQQQYQDQIYQQEFQQYKSEYQPLEQQQQNTLKGYKKQTFQTHGNQKSKRKLRGENKHFKKPLIFPPSSQLIFSTPHIIRRKRIAEKLSDNHMKRYSDSKFYSQELSLVAIAGKLELNKSSTISFKCIYQDQTYELFVGVLDFASLQRSDIKNMNQVPPAYMKYMNSDGLLFSDSAIKNSPLILKKFSSFSITYLSEEQQLTFEQNGIEESVQLQIQEQNNYHYFVYSKRVMVDILQ